LASQPLSFTEIKQSLPFIPPSVQLSPPAVGIAGRSSISHPQHPIDLDEQLDDIKVPFNAADIAVHPRLAIFAS
jgi:hypothetical protein